MGAATTAWSSSVPPGNRRRRRCRIHAVLDKPRRELPQPDKPHVDDQRLIRLRQFRPVEIDDIVAQMAGDEPDGLRPVAMGQRYAGVRRASERGGNAGNDLEVDAMPAQCLDLFAAAAEDERVPALEARHPPTLPRIAEQERVDVRLPRAGEGATLADVDPFRVATAQFQHPGRDEIVIVDDVRPLQRAQRFQGEEVRVAGTGAH